MRERESIPFARQPAQQQLPPCLPDPATGKMNLDRGPTETFKESNGIFSGERRGRKRTGIEMTKYQLLRIFPENIQCWTVTWYYGCFSGA
jgi:hypothetical protein